MNSPSAQHAVFRFSSSLLIAFASTPLAQSSSFLGPPRCSSRRLSLVASLLRSSLLTCALVVFALSTSCRSLRGPFVGPCMRPVPSHPFGLPSGSLRAAHGHASAGIVVYFAIARILLAKSLRFKDIYYIFSLAPSLCLRIYSLRSTCLPSLSPAVCLSVYQVLGLRALLLLATALRMVTR